MIPFQFNHRIYTPRLELIACNAELLRKLIFEKAWLEKALTITIPDNFSQFGTPPLQYSMEKLGDPQEAGWWTFLPIHLEARTLIGTCGYKGKPDAHGMVEIGYEVVEILRRKGYGAEIAKALVSNAFRYDEVRFIRAHTLAEENPSVKILRSCNFKFISTIHDPEDGELWCWELLRQDIT